MIDCISTVVCLVQTLAEAPILLWLRSQPDTLNPTYRTKWDRGSSIGCY